jgi:hypothetical protein
VAASQRAGASLREGFAFRSGRLTTSAAQRQLISKSQPRFFLLKEKAVSNLVAKRLLHGYARKTIFIL